jgi:hypothetical protein
MSHQLRQQLQKVNKMATLTLNTRAKLFGFLNQLSGPVTAVMKTKTEVRMNKKDVATKSVANPFGKIYKLQEVIVEINRIYEDTVNDERVMEGKKASFEAEGLPWGTAVNNIVILKDGMPYIKTIETGKVGSATYLTETGQVIKYSDIAPFIPNYTGSTKQGLVDEVKVRTFKISSILEISFNNGKVIYQ